MSHLQYRLLIGWCSDRAKKNPKSSDITLHIHDKHLFDSGTYPVDEFCVDIKKDTWISAEVCKKAIEHTKFK